MEFVTIAPGRNENKTLLKQSEKQNRKIIIAASEMKKWKIQMNNKQKNVRKKNIKKTYNSDREKC